MTACGELDNLRTTILNEHQSIEGARHFVNRGVGQHYAKIFDEGFVEFLRVIAETNMKRVHAVCESPIEKLFFGSLIWTFACSAPYSLLVSEEIKKGERSTLEPWMYERLPFLRASVHLQLQASIKLSRQWKRADAIAWVPSDESFTPIVIECDGFKYHGSEESFTKDRQRDRMFSEEGFRVLRYSGSEIWSSPANTAASLQRRLMEESENARRHG